MIIFGDDFNFNNNKTSTIFFLIRTAFIISHITFCASYAALWCQLDTLVMSRFALLYFEIARFNWRHTSASPNSLQTAAFTFSKLGQ